MTHPCWSVYGYKCTCGYESVNKETHNLHVTACHSKEEAEKLLSARDFDKLYKNKLQTISEEK